MSPTSEKVNLPSVMPCNLSEALLKGRGDMDGESNLRQFRRPAVQRWCDSQNRTEADSPDRLAGDRELHAILAANNFTGPDYTEFEAVLVDYGFAVCRAWARDGLLLTKCRERGVRGVPLDPDHLMGELAPADVEELSSDIVADAIIIFREQSMVGGRWRPTGTASLRTFFVNRCLFSTPGPAGRMLRHKRKQREVCSLDDPDFTSHPDPSTPDIADDLVDSLAAADLVAQTPVQLTDRERTALRCHMQGMPAREIATTLGTTPKAASSCVYRAQTKLRQDPRWEEWTA